MLLVVVLLPDGSGIDWHGQPAIANGGWTIKHGRKQNEPVAFMALDYVSLQRLIYPSAVSFFCGRSLPVLSSLPLPAVASTSACCLYRIRLAVAMSDRDYRFPGWLALLNHLFHQPYS